MSAKAVLCPSLRKSFSLRFSLSAFAAPRRLPASHPVVMATEDAWHCAGDARGGTLPGPGRLLVRFSWIL